jgi:hypothetical protein
MPDDTTTDDGGEPQGLPQVREALNRETARRQELETQLADAQAAQREVVFLRAGVDLDSKPGQLVAKAYDGELDAEAIKVFAADIPGALRGETPPPVGTEPAPDDGPTPAEAAAAAADAALSSGGAPPGATPDKPLGIDMMDSAFAAQGGTVRARPAAGMSDRATAAGLQVLLNRAVAGDPQAVFKAADETWADATDRWRATQ